MVHDVLHDIVGTFFVKSIIGTAINSKLWSRKINLISIMEDFGHLERDQQLGFSRSWRSFFFLAFFESDFFKKQKNHQEKNLACQEIFLAFFL